MPETIAERIDKYLKHRGLGTVQAEKKMGISNGLLGKAIKREGGVNSDLIEKLLSHDPRLNARWLLTGEGEMEAESRKSDNRYEEVVYLNRLIEEKNDRLKEIGDLYEEGKDCLNDLSILE